jgi:hypothetical protein
VKPAALALTCAALLVVLVLVGSICSAGPPKIAVRNDLDFEIALIRCESKSIFGDDTYIKPSEVKSLRSAMTCMVLRPSRRVGFLGGARDNGGYIGCLLMPDGERKGKEVLVSDADPEIDDRVCDGVE